MVESPRKIAVDCDDVLFDFSQELQTYHNLLYGTKLRLGDVFDYDLSRVWGCSQKDAIARVTRFYHSDNFLGLKPIIGAVESVKQLAQDNQLLVITSRPIFIVDRTVSLIEQFFPNCFSGLHFLGSF
ncbi:hypothetical protein M1563_04235 [Patescibacteria group bacterium]|nr:hypothetical protein [Patescibacteria group bacterium]